MKVQHEDQNDSADNRSVTEILKSMVHSFQEIFRAELRLAGIELKAKAQQGMKGAGLLGAAAVLGFLSAACFVTTCIVALAIVLPLWLAALLMAVMLAFGAGGAYMLGRLTLQEIDPIPQKTVETLKETLDRANTPPTP